MFKELLVRFGNFGYFQLSIISSKTFYRVEVTLEVFPLFCERHLSLYTVFLSDIIRHSGTSRAINEEFVLCKYKDYRY